MDGDIKKVIGLLGNHANGGDERTTLSWLPHASEVSNDHKTTYNWGSSRKEGNDEKISFGWGPNNKNDDLEITHQRGTNTNEDIEKVIDLLGNHANVGDEKTTLSWLPHASKFSNDQKTTYNWGSSRKEGNDEKISFGWGPHNKNDDHRINHQWGTNTDGDIEKVIDLLRNHANGGDEKTTLSWLPPASEFSNDHKTTYNWGSSRKEGNDEKISFGWGSNKKNDDQKVSYQWGPRKNKDIEKFIDLLGIYANGDGDKISLRWSSDSQNIVSLDNGSHLREGHHHHHVHGTGHNHGQFNMENLLFLEAVLTPGTFITPYIESSVSPTPFLRREIADSIPISTKNFTDILTMFSPESLVMAGKIWSTLRTCEHPHPLEGERQACATSVESMVELAASVLGTPDLRAFSSYDVPTEGFIASPSEKYMVAAVRAVTTPGEEATTMTCHGITFPYAVFYCHAVNPTRVYEVTLQIISSEEEDEDKKKKNMMQVLAVCHLDTSQFDPKNPFFVLRGLKPGDAAVCHFLSRDSVLWAPTAASAQGHPGAEVAVQ